ncbi:unnamed protein product [Agarophyton chilense]
MDSSCVFRHRLHDVLNVPNSIAALVLLNGPSLSQPLLTAVWPSNEPTICADGAANLLHACSPDRTPSHIIGDLDSINPQTRSYYQSKGTDIIRDESQDYNDFQKATRLVLSKASTKPIVVMGGHGGRFDQTLGNLNTLFSTAELGRVIIWLDEKNGIVALPPGIHHVSINPSVEGPTCGLIPVGRPVKQVHTQGLKWNVDGPLSFGEEAMLS